MDCGISILRLNIVRLRLPRYGRRHQADDSARYSYDDDDVRTIRIWNRFIYFNWRLNGLRNFNFVLVGKAGQSPEENHRRQSLIWTTCSTFTFEISPDAGTNLHRQSSFDSVTDIPSTRQHCRPDQQHRD